MLKCLLGRPILLYVPVMGRRCHVSLRLPASCEAMLCQPSSSSKHSALCRQENQRRRQLRQPATEAAAGRGAARPRIRMRTRTRSSTATPQPTRGGRAARTAALALGRRNSAPVPNAGGRICRRLQLMHSLLPAKQTRPPTAIWFNLNICGQSQTEGSLASQPFLETLLVSVAWRALDLNLLLAA